VWVAIGLWSNSLCATAILSSGLLWVNAALFRTS
jgi:hypothetical protein